MNNSFFEKSKDDENNLMSDINVTPLVDVMLVLLIVFIITMPVLFTQIRLDFPTTSDLQDNKGKEDPLMIKITLDKEGNYYLDDKLITSDDLELYIKDKLSKQEDKNKIIFALNAELETKYGYLIKLINIIQKNGGTKIGYMEEVR